MDPRVTRLIDAVCTQEGLWPEGRECLLDRLREGGDMALILAQASLGASDRVLMDLIRSALPPG